VVAVARSVAASPHLALEAVWTHFATADEPDGTFMDRQRERLEQLAGRLRQEFPGIIVHAANSAAVISDPATHFDLVRPGVAVYGMDPFGLDPVERGLRPVLSLHSYVATVKRFEPGMSAPLRSARSRESARDIGDRAAGAFAPGHSPLPDSFGIAVAIVGRPRSPEF